MASIWDRVGTALKAGAKGAADTLLAPPASSSPAPSPTPSYVPGMGISTPTSSGLPSWVLPAAGIGLVVLLVARK